MRLILHNHLQYDSYLNQYAYNDDKIKKINFTNKKEQKNLLYFEVVFEEITNTAIKELAIDSTLSLIDIINIKQKFIEIWYKENLNEQYPNQIIDYNKKMSDNNFLEIYYYVLFSGAKPDEVTTWVKNNPSTVNQYITWLPNNQFKFKD